VLEPEMREGDCVRDKYAFSWRASRMADGEEGTGETSGKLVEKDDTGDQTGRSVRQSRGRDYVL